MELEITELGFKNWPKSRNKIEAQERKERFQLEAEAQERKEMIEKEEKNREMRQRKQR